VQDGRERVVIENVLPQVEEGRYPIKRVIGESVTVSADIFCDGHDEISAELLFRKSTEEQFSRKEMRFAVNDRWTGSFRCEEMVPYIYTVRGWVDQFKTWQTDLRKKFAAGQDIGPTSSTAASWLKRLPNGPSAKHVKNCSPCLNGYEGQSRWRADTDWPWTRP
jgi:hypothetical protein